MAKRCLPPANDPCPEHWLEREGLPCQLERNHTGMHHFKGPAKVGDKLLNIELWWNFGQAICDAKGG